MNKLIFEYDTHEGKTYSLPKTAIDNRSFAPIEKYMRKTDAKLPNLCEYQVAEHYKSLLSDKACMGDNFLNNIFDDMSRLDGFTGVHPYQLPDACQGALELVFTLGHMLCDMFGMKQFTFQPSSVTGGVLTALGIIKAYAEKQRKNRKVILVSEDADEILLSYIEKSGFEAKKLDFGAAELDKEELSAVAGAVMEISPLNTRDLSHIFDIAAILRDNDCIVCCDANKIKSFIGELRPGDMGFDMMYFDVENVFEVANFEGECDCAALGVTEKLLGYMPVPVIEIDDEEQYYLSFDKPDSIGKVNDFYGDFSCLIKTISYILSLGFDGLKENAHLHALREKYGKLRLD